MKLCGAAMVATAIATLAAPQVAGAQSALFNGIPIGTTVGALAASLGPPALVASEDSGNRFVFSGGTTAFADDDGIVLALATQSGSARVEVDGAPRTFAVGTYSVRQADAELAGVAEFATPTLRSYRLEPRRDLVFAFGAATQRLERVTYGEPGQLARLGLLPGDAASKAVVYRAPRPRTPAAIDTIEATALRPAIGASAAPGQLATTYRITIDRGGAVTAVDAAIPSASPSADASVAVRLREQRFVPATLDGRAIAAAIFIEVRH